MKFNSIEMIEFATRQGEQEGRMTYKPPSKSLYDTAYKERWFKLKGNLLFYYRLNEEGVVEKNEPNGVFVLENITVERDQEDLKCSFGFTIIWKDDPFRKHSFYTSSENTLQTWITKLIAASYENLRADLLKLRMKIYQKSGNDPLEHLGIRLPIRSLRGMYVLPSKVTPPINKPVSMSLSTSDVGQAVNRDASKMRVSIQPSSAPTTPSLNPKFEEPINPIPPPRTNRDRRKSKTSSVAPDEVSKKVRPREVTFKSHINNSEDLEASSSKFKSHIKEKLSQEELEEFLKKPFDIGTLALRANFVKCTHHLKEKKNAK